MLPGLRVMAGVGVTSHTNRRWIAASALAFHVGIALSWQMYSVSLSALTLAA